MIEDYVSRLSLEVSKQQHAIAEAAARLGCQVQFGLPSLEVVGERDGAAVVRVVTPCRVVAVEANRGSTDMTTAAAQDVWHRVLRGVLVQMSLRWKGEWFSVGELTHYTNLQHGQGDPVDEFSVATRLAAMTLAGSAHSEQTVKHGTRYRATRADMKDYE